MISLPLSVSRGTRLWRLFTDRDDLAAGLLVEPGVSLGAVAMRNAEDLVRLGYAVEVPADSPKCTLRALRTVEGCRKQTAYGTTQDEAVRVAYQVAKYLAGKNTP